MKKQILNLAVILMIILVAGCASTVKNKKDSPEGDQQTDNAAIHDRQANDSGQSDFILGDGDTIEISVYRHDDLNSTVRIDSSGKIMFPLIGDLKVTGKSLYMLRDEMQDKLSKYLINPQVTINVQSVQSQKIIVLGEVNSPGIFTLDSEISVLEAITRAGGMTNNAEMSNVLLVRRGKEKTRVASLDLEKAFQDGSLFQIRSLRNGDIIYVPEEAISNLGRYFSHLSQILGPILNLGSSIVIWDKVVDIMEGNSTGNTPLSIPTR